MFRKNIWLLLRKAWLKCVPVNFRIGISFEFTGNKNAKNYHKQLSKNLLNIIDELRLGKQLKAQVISEIKVFKSIEDAESFRGKKNLDLLIWGRLSNDGLKKMEKKPQKWI